MKARTDTPAASAAGAIGPACIAYRTRMLSRVISAIYDEALAPLDLRGSQLNVLSALARRGPSTPTELCAVLRMDKSTLSRNVARMRRRGWLATDADDDRRTHTLRLTATGTRLLREAFPLWQKAQDEAARRMGGAGVAALATLVKRLRALDAAAPESVASLPRRARRSG